MATDAIDLVRDAHETANDGDVTVLTGLFDPDTQPIVFQSVRVRAGRIAHIQDYRKRGPALRRG